MQKTVVIIEDEKDIIESLQVVLERKQFKVNSYTSAEEFFENKKEHTNCVFLVDWNLPGIKGIEIIKRIRDKDKISSIFMVSAYSSSEQIIQGLETGADDYITKPFNYDELVIRVNNAHAKINSLKENLLNVGIKLIDEANSVIKDGTTVQLTSREYIIFKYLYDCPNSSITREQLISEFDKEMDVTARNIDVHIFSLRKKLKKIKISIETIWGTGYQIKL